MGLRLSPAEQVRVRTRAHPRALTLPVLRLMFIALATGYVQGVLARGDLHEALVQVRPWLAGAVWVLAALALLLGCLRPAWRWLTRTTVLTSLRIIQRAGPGRSRERALHLLAIYDVRLRQRRGQRMAGAGDLIIEHGAGSQWVLAGMPEAVRFRELILREVAALRRQVAEQGAPPYSVYSVSPAAPAPASPGSAAGGGFRG
ncbi:MAG: PH domain-containing protein [Micrococcus sp.]|nr:PH domain-containing protein [Micrococcus sp.]